jgi:hypothetical protein
MMPAMKRTSLAVLSCSLLGLAGACRQENGVSVQEAVLEFSPLLLDLGATSVGIPTEDAFAVDHLGGLDGRILNVDILADQGGHFEFAGELPIDVDRGTRAELPLRFLADTVGYFSASVQISHNGKDSPVVLDIRGAALPPTVEISPRSLDFGPVEVGEERLQFVTVANRGAADLAITERFFSDGAFVGTFEVPLVVAAGREERLAVTFAPRNRSAVSATLELFAEDTALPVVLLSGNDCENGLPESYDRDEDGFTSCGGDCDDDREDIRPGSPELPDSVDQDCDGEVDEGTTNTDDDHDGFAEARGDCNDANDAVHPDATELIGNGIDDDCDGVVDIAGADLDGDGYSTGGGDCDDGDADIHPGATEGANDVDDDCDGTKDEGTVARDDDGDGFCERSVNCTDGSTGGDCDDSSVTTAPNAPEVLDGRDNNCDGGIDEGTAAADDDGDGYTENGGDCDDSDPALSPGLGTC